MRVFRINGRCCNIAIFRIMGRGIIVANFWNNLHIYTNGKFLE